MKIKKKLKKAFILLFVCSAFSVVSQESMDSVFSELNLAFTSKSAEEVSSVLHKYSSSPQYHVYEAYALKKTRQLIIENDLEFARQTSLAVIDNNLENFDAVELYSYIDRAILNEQAAKQAEENRLRLEAERLAAINEKTKAKIEKSNAYQTLSTQSGSQVYVKESNQTFSSVDWRMQLCMADLLFQSVPDKDYSSLKYGLGAGADIFYNVDSFILAADIFADFQMLNLKGGEQEFFVSARFVPMIAFPEFSRNLYFRMGFASYGVATEFSQISGSTESFMTPVFGIGLENVALGSTEINGHFDYYLGHFAYDMQFSFEAGAGITLPVAVNEHTKIGFRIGASDIMFLKESGMENRFKGIIGIGVGNVVK